jgi:hypothetical protein
MQRLMRTGLIAALATSGLAASPARADTDTGMATFMIVSGAAMLGLGTVGLVEIYTADAPKTEEERVRRRDAEPFMWLGVTGGLACFGFAALLLSEDEEDASGACDDDGAPCEGASTVAPTHEVAPLAGLSWGAAATLRW